MKNLKVSTVILTIAFIGLTAVSCKEAKKDNTNEDGHQMEASHDNSDGHHDEEATHDNSDGHHDEDHSTMDSGNMDHDGDMPSHDMNNHGEKSTNANMIVDSYLQIKNALVQDDKSKAVAGGKMMVSAFSNFDMASLTEEQHKEYMEIAESAKEHAEHIVKSPIDHQREHFEVLSTDISDLVTLIGTDKTLYQDFCPMAAKGKGAIWLSEIKEIKNPYMGSKMVTCGNMQKQIN